MRRQDEDVTRRHGDETATRRRDAETTKLRHDTHETRRDGGDTAAKRRRDSGETTTRQDETATRRREEMKAKDPPPHLPMPYLAAGVDLSPHLSHHLSPTLSLPPSLPPSLPTISPHAPPGSVCVEPHALPLQHEECVCVSSVCVCRDSHTVAHGIARHWGLWARAHTKHLTLHNTARGTGNRRAAQQPR